MKFVQFNVGNKKALINMDNVTMVLELINSAAIHFVGGTSVITDVNFNEIHDSCFSSVEHCELEEDFNH